MPRKRPSEAVKRKLMAMNVTRAKNDDQTKKSRALQHEAVEKHHASATSAAIEPDMLSTWYVRPNTCGCGGCRQAKALQEEPLTITSAVLTHGPLRKHADLAAELVAHGIEVKKDGGKIFPKAALSALASEHLLAKGAYVLTISKEDFVDKPAAKKSKQVQHTVFESFDYL